MSLYANAPLAQDGYTRFMVDSFDERRVIATSTGFQTFFGRPEANGSLTRFSPDANTAVIDIIRGNEKLSALVPRGTVSRPLGSLQKDLIVEKYSNFNRVFPLMYEEGPINADQLLTRNAGENPYEGRTKMRRLRYLAATEHQEQVRRMVRTFEYLASQSILEGVMPAILGTTNPDLQYDFRRNPANIVTLITPWTGAADIMGDIDEACEIVRANGRTNPDMMLLGGDAMSAFINDTNVQAQADNRRIELIQVSTNNPVPPRFARFVEAGFIARGRLRTEKGWELWLFTYTDIYDDSTGTAQNYMPKSQVLICSSMARCDRYFGPDETLPGIPMREQFYQQMFGFDPMSAPMPMNIKNPGQVISPAMFWFDAYANTQWTNVVVRAQSAPIFAPAQTDAFFTYKNVA